nr:glycosyltransferase [Erythrobacter sp.]
MLDTACGIVANSGHTLGTLAEYAAAANRIMPPAAVAWPGTPILPPVSARPEDEPTFVILGTIEGRKNHALLLSVWQQLIWARGAGAAPHLVIVGRRGWQADEVFARLDRYEFAGRVTEVGPLDDRRLANILSGSRALLFPSFAEGYGIPLVEALAAGVPVIASDLPVFREIGQGVPDLLPVDDVAAWCDAVSDYSQQPSSRRDAQLFRMKEFRVPDWRDHFGTVDALMDVLGR